jgi:hypothetical protein
VKHIPFEVVGAGRVNDGLKPARLNQAVNLSRYKIISVLINYRFMIKQSRKLRLTTVGDPLR